MTEEKLEEINYLRAEIHNLRRKLADFRAASSIKGNKEVILQNGDSVLLDRNYYVQNNLVNGDVICYSYTKEYQAFLDSYVKAMEEDLEKAIKEFEAL